jgi:MFS family permease
LKRRIRQAHGLEERRAPATSDSASQKSRPPAVELSGGLNFEFFRANLGNLLVLTGSVMFVLLPEYLQDQHMDRWKIGLVDGSFWFISIFVQPWLGKRLDKDGRKLYLMLGSLLMALAAASYAWVPVELFPMLGARLVHGFGFACYLTASWTWVADFSPPSRVGEFFGIFGISGMLAGAVGPGLAEYVVAHQEYANLFFWGGATIFVGWMVMATISDRRPETAVHAKPPSFFSILRSRVMRGPVLGSVAFGIAVGSLFAFIAPYLSTLKIQGVGWMFAVTTLASGGSRVYAGRLTDRLGPARMVGPSIFLLSVGCFGLALVSQAGAYALVLLVASGLAAGLGYGVIYPALNAVAIERLDSATRGRGLALITASIDSGSFSGAALAGLVSHNQGYPAAFQGIALLLLLFLGIFASAERGQLRYQHITAEAGETGAPAE